MKFAALFVCIIALTTTVQPFHIGLFDPIKSAFESTFPVEEVKEAYHCVLESKDSVEQLIDLAKKMLSGQFEGVKEDYQKIAADVHQMLSDCKVLFCWEPTYKKCVTEHPDVGCEKDGHFLYPKCKEGLTSHLGVLCSNTCPENFSDQGLFCGKPGAYGRGVGYAIWNKNKCEAENSQGCEKNGLIWYPKCKEGFHNVGCCICSPNCPESWTDVGVSCKKPDFYSRGVGYPVHFGPDCLTEKLGFLKKIFDKLKAEDIDCKEQLEKIAVLKDLVEGKLVAEFEHQQGFTEQITLLSDHILGYIQSCPLEPIQ